MPYTMEQFRKDYVKAHLDDLDPEERLKGLKAEEVLSRFKAEERLKGLSVVEVEAYLKKLKKTSQH